MSTQEESAAEKLYKNKNIAGPMVRGSSHIFRLACLHYGADVVFSPGIVDLKLKQSTVDSQNGHTVFLAKSNGHNETVFETCEAEKGHIILQIISNDGATALEACQKVYDFVDGFDLNCGCPEQFATHRNCGSSMELETAVDVIKTLKRNISKPISVKFRVKDTNEESIQFAQAIESAGADAITVHGRLKEQKHEGAVDYDKMKLIFDSVNIIKIGNGGVKSLEDAAKMREMTGCSGVMMCRAAMMNPSIFSADVQKPIDVLSQMAILGEQHHLEFSSCKFSLQQVLQSTKQLARAMTQPFGKAKTWDEFNEIVRENQ
ncbi:tRNA-dihydrouridine(20) synthase [NAD(P)+]-like [Histomonas meleagridis]|uniref:tRNA-dihydrouridine(20) synthase [NAD(P)+]-like n=1 Tax=Histomonas meleagridis TaxID=135588 RepID=UPI003559F732|nr:tRNA-dihydrouridine(20) synthase [NAD(P)+]-like [Histomonas meleagridis]KAH0803652.1 tRNA-dihydrouridine(20) synthase [NAD(P)+]-like [Histomonas meleagridis]